MDLDFIDLGFLLVGPLLPSTWGAWLVVCGAQYLLRRTLIWPTWLDAALPAPVRRLLNALPMTESRESSPPSDQTAPTLEWSEQTRSLPEPADPSHPLPAAADRTMPYPDPMLVARWQDTHALQGTRSPAAPWRLPAQNNHPGPHTGWHPGTWVAPG